VKIVIRENKTTKNACLRFQVGYTETRPEAYAIYGHDMNSPTFGHVVGYREGKTSTVFHLMGHGETLAIAEVMAKKNGIDSR
jgi:hypothetical protein